ncbi:MAG: ABC transporter substrate-binding protein [Thermostichus sp. HHBFW_bins_43]
MVNRKQQHRHWAVKFSLTLILGAMVVGAATAGRGYSQPEGLLGGQAPSNSSDVGNQATDSRWADIRERGYLRVGLDPSLGHAYLYTDLDRETYAGFEWDILEAIARRLQVQVNPIYVAWSEQLAALQADEVDLIWGAREPLGLDAEQFLATQPYYLSPQRLVVRDPSPKDSVPPTREEPPIEELSQLFGRKVGIVVNSTGAALLEAYNERRGNAIRLFATSNPERLFAQLQAGQLDAVLIDQPVAAMNLRQPGSRLRLTGPPLFPVPLVGVVSSQHPSLKQAVDEAIATLSVDGTLQQILEKWQLWDPAVMSPASTEG